MTGLYFLKKPYAKFKLGSLFRKSKLNRVWIEGHSPMLMNLKLKLTRDRPFDGIKIGTCLPGTWESFMFHSTLEAGGAHIACYPLFCLPEVGIEFLKSDNIRLYGQNDFYKCIMDSDFVHDTAATFGEAIINSHNKVKGVIEQTASGTYFYEKSDKNGLLRQPVFNLDSSHVKRVGENQMATGLGLIEALLKLHIFLPDKQVLILGFGNIGFGCASYLKRIGCKVSVFDINPKKTADAEGIGYPIGDLEDLLPQADIVVNTTGSPTPVLKANELEKLKSGTILANMGGYGWDREYLLDKYIQNVGDHVLRVSLNHAKCIYELAAGSPVNFVLASGTDMETMDLVFSLAIMVMQYMVENSQSLPAHLLSIPKEIQEKHMQQIAKISARKVF